MIESINALQSLDNVPNINNIQFSTDKVDTSFMDFINTKVDLIDNSIKTANHSIKSYALGENISTHELMIALETAKYELQLAIEVRNKVIEAYQELSRMQL